MLNLIWFAQARAKAEIILFSLKPIFLLIFFQIVVLLPYPVKDVRIHSWGITLDELDLWAKGPPPFPIFLSLVVDIWPRILDFVVRS